MSTFEKCRSPVRWIILVLGCLMMVGSYYSFDIPSALKTQIDDYTGNKSDYEVNFSLMYTLYSAPNVILPFFGGYLVDRFGVSFCLLIFSTLIAVGQVVFTIGLSTKSWPVIFIGRLIFGLGGESFTVANSALLSDWFKGTELAFAFGVNLSISKLGSVINNIVSPILAEKVDIVFALWFGAILCGVGVGCVFLTIPLQKNAEVATLMAKKNLGPDALLLEADESKELQEELLLKGDESSLVEEQEQPSIKDVTKFPVIFWVLVVSCVTVYGCVLPFNNISSSLLLERNYFKEPSDSCVLLDPNQCQSSTNYPMSCPSSHWYQPPLPDSATVGGVLYDPLEISDIDCSDDLWKDGCTKEYCDRQSDAISQASYMMSIPYIISAILSPPLGYLVDIYGFRAIISTISPIILIFVHVFLATLSSSPVVPLIGQGLAYTGFVSVLWPSVPLVVEERLIGLGFGVLTSMQNLATALIPLIIAKIASNNDGNYIPNVEYLFVSLACIGTVVGLYMNYYDFYHANGILNAGLDLSNDDELIQDDDTKNPFHVGEDDGSSENLSEARASYSYNFQSGSRNPSIDIIHKSNRSRGPSFSNYEEVYRAKSFDRKNR